jgi:CHAD domain-containing protein
MDRLGDLATVLGALRDLDVQADQVVGWVASSEGAERGTLEFVAAELGDRRRQARRRALAKLMAPRTSRLLESLEGLLTRGMKRTGVARASILVLAPELLAHEHRKLVVLGDSIGPDSTAEALHSVRIRCKRMRYAVESFRPWYGKPARAYARRLTSIEDVLGVHQDAVVAAATLRDIAIRRGRRLGAAQLFALGGLAERCLERARAARAEFPERYRAVDGRRWRRLVHAVDEARP